MRRNTNTRAPLLVLAFFALLLGMVRPPPGKLTIPQYPVSAHGSGMFESRPFFVRPPGVMPFNRLVWYPHRHHVRARHSYRWRFSHHHRFLEQFATPIQHVVIVYMEIGHLTTCFRDITVIRILRVAREPLGALRSTSQTQRDQYRR